MCCETFTSFVSYTVLEYRDVPQALTHSHTQDGSVVHFKIKRNTQLKKLMQAYADRQVSWQPYMHNFLLYLYTFCSGFI